jgi:hypothetical protein
MWQADRGDSREGQRTEAMRAEAMRAEPMRAEPMRADGYRGDFERIESDGAHSSRAEPSRAEPYSRPSPTRASRAADPAVQGGYGAAAYGAQQEPDAEPYRERMPNGALGGNGAASGWNVPSWDSGLAAAEPIRRPWNPSTWEADRSWSAPSSNLPAVPELPALPPAPPSREQPAESLAPAWEPPPWSPPAWDEPVRPPVSAPMPAERQTLPLRSPDWSMLDRLGPDRGISDSTGSWSFVATTRSSSEYELPSIDHLPEPESGGRHSRRAGRHSAGAGEGGEDLASERRLYFDLPPEPGGRGGQPGRQPEPGSWEEQQRWGGQGGWGR